MAEGNKQVAKKSVSGSTSAGTTASGGTKASTKRKDNLVWNTARREALVLAMRGGMTRVSDLANHLSNHESFDGDPAKVTDVKVRAEIKRLRKAGVKIPDTSGRGSQPVDVERLNALLAGGGSAQAGGNVQAGAGVQSAGGGTYATGEDGDD